MKKVEVKNEVSHQIKPDVKNEVKKEADIKKEIKEEVKEEKKVERKVEEVPEKLKEVVVPVATDEPLGYINNVMGVPQVVIEDKYLEPYQTDLLLRQNEFKKWLEIFDGAEGGLLKIARSYKKFGLNILPNNDITFLEWAPQAKSISIFGDFNNWNRDQYKAARNEFGCFALTLKACDDGTPLIKHLMKYKLQVEGPDGKKMDRNSPWAALHNQGNSSLFDCVFWNPPE